MEKSEKIWMDGKLVPWNEANIHVLTHTLHYGLGVFEGIRCYNSMENGPAIFRLQAVSYTHLTLPTNREV